MNMEYELESKEFYINEFQDKKDMNHGIKKYIAELKYKYPQAIVTKEFVRDNRILVKATLIKNIPIQKRRRDDKQEELEKEEVRIKERGINGVGENANRRKNGKERTHGGTERERC